MAQAVVEQALGIVFFNLQLRVQERAFGTYKAADAGAPVGPNEDEGDDRPGGRTYIRNKVATSHHTTIIPSIMLFAFKVSGIIG